ncbi:vacuolar protein-sorting-associated protein 25-like [Gigantopelta aegis]|uniref:vacuolar protein-sorting-associated protein 25-like n=1 Tax=Gigantopelta aegis TaxID=1735272 RepID=UPI001B88873C|nr:vacuolar protein-sorting-associated protein 25-like [Gigantopelta aegis]
MATENFEFPWQYKFPPFFTIQPNLETRKKQLEAWCSLIIDYQKHARSYRLDVTEAHNSPLFHNKSINRKLSQDEVYIILEELRKRGHIEWQDKTKKQCLVMWRTPEQWGKQIYKWISDNSMTNTVCTYYEITEGDDSKGQEFHGLEKWLLVRALQTLQSQGKAELISAGGTEGVKFF